MEDDWDLHAVVRGCAAAATSDTKSYNTGHQDCTSSTRCFEDLFEQGRNNFIKEELRDLCKPFFSSSEHASPPPPPHIVKKRPQQSFSVSTGSRTGLSYRSKRRKSHAKRVCHVAVENLSSDVWSWRKYGQKPIKGSPYPRGYYRCSTSKACMARKQVERNRSDPGMFIVTYTAEHNHPTPTHRNSLAGTTRHKPPEKMESIREEDLAEAGDDDGDEISVSKMAVDDDLFADLEDFTAGECTSGHFPASLQFPRLSAIATTTAGGG